MGRVEEGNGLEVIPVRQGSARCDGIASNQ